MAEDQPGDDIEDMFTQPPIKMSEEYEAIQVELENLVSHYRRLNSSAPFERVETTAYRVLQLKFAERAMDRAERHHRELLESIERLRHQEYQP